MEKWKILGVLGILLILFGAYSYYATPKIYIAEQHSYLSIVDVADSIIITAGNFSAVQGLLSVTITPNDGYLFNSTLTITTDDPNCEIKVYSDVPLKMISGGIQNATLRIPLTKDQIKLDIIFTFSNTTITHPVELSIASGTISNSTTVYAVP